MPVVPSYTGVWDWEDHSSRPACGKKLTRPHLDRKKSGSDGKHLSSCQWQEILNRITFQTSLAKSNTLSST
jgi:hypothetical protein